LNSGRKFSRRKLLLRTGRLSVGLGAAAVLPTLLSACGDDDQAETVGGTGPTGGGAVTPADAQGQALVLVGDVLDFRLRNEDGWAWAGGWVKMRLHEAMFSGQSVYYICTDASDREFAESEKLVFVPKLQGALDSSLYGDIYVFTDGAPEQTAVVSTAPGQDDFTPLLRINRVSWNGQPRLLQSVVDVKEEASAGAASIEATEIIVNCPFVKWSDGELPVDGKLEKALDGGPLVSAPDLDLMSVVLKLHQCYPESYYILTDTSAIPMTGMMNVAGAPKAEGLVQAGATEKIYVFANGIPGFAAMGFQPSVFASKAGQPSWSPMWEHVTAMWNDGMSPALLTSEGEIMPRADAGELKLFPGTPDTGGQSFVVNCPAPIVAPNTFNA
jgi:hypothetical protein